MFVAVSLKITDALLPLQEFKNANMTSKWSLMAILFLLLNNDAMNNDFLYPFLFGNKMAIAKK